MAGNIEQEPLAQEVLWPDLKAQAPQIEIPSPTVEVIAQTRKKRSKPRFGDQDSIIEGVKFIVEKDGHVVFNRRDTRRLQADTDRIARSKRYETTAATAKKRLVEAKAKQPGFAGVISERGNYRSPLYSSEQAVKYNPVLLEISTGQYHQELVREEGQLVLSFPARKGVQASIELEEFAKTVANIMVEQGRDPQEVGNLITPTIIHRLDEEKLLELINEGKIKLVPGTKKATIAWKVDTDPINPDIKPKKQKLSPKKT